MKNIKKIIKIIISLPIAYLFIYFAYTVFIYSLNDDTYIHFLKNNFKNDISNIDSQFVGFKSEFVSSNKNITSKYGNYSVVFYRLDYQQYVCSVSKNKKKCHWDNYKTESNSTSFIVTNNYKQINITQTSKYNFQPEYDKTYIINKTNRVLQYSIKTNEPIYIWGYLQNDKITEYSNNTFNKKIFIITNNAEQTLISFINIVLFTQIGSAIIIIIMMIMLFLINKNKKNKFYIATNKSRNYKSNYKNYKLK